MDFSDQWRSLFSIPSTFSSPSLLSSPSLGPVRFFPSSPSVHLSLVPSLQIPPPFPPSSQIDALTSLFSDPSAPFFLPHSSLLPLASQLSLPSAADPILSNYLCYLRRRSSPSTAFLFFPTGDNSNLVGFSILSLDDPSNPHLLPPQICTQRDGFRHPYHRITKLSAVPASDLDSVLNLSGESTITVEGFLIAATLYSVNWFRVETKVSSSGQETVGLVRMGKQRFAAVVVDARVNPHCPEESIVLLESGELCWFDIETKGSRLIRVSEKCGECLACDFGAQPWIVLVACAWALVMVDLREEKGTEPKVLARVNDLVEGKKDRILAFCRPDFDNFRVSVVTERRLLLFDIRQPLDPVLMWDHGLHSPCYVAMFRLSEMRQCEKFSWASGSGYVVLVGSFWKDEFSIFCCGPKEGVFGDSFIYAWSLPMSFDLSGRQSRSPDELVRESFYGCSEQRKGKDVVVGFRIVPNDHLQIESENGGFVLVRLMLSGKLEMQRYHASWDSIRDKFNFAAESSTLNESVISSVDSEGKTSPMYYYLNIRHLCEYLNGTLTSVFNVHEPKISRYNRSFASDHLLELENIKQNMTTSSICTHVSDATVPANIFEITLRRMLNDLEMDLLPLAFSKYSLLFGNHREAAFSLLEVPRSLRHHRLIPFFLDIPLRKVEKRPRKALPDETFVGPVFPVPVLLILQQLADQQKTSSCLKEEPDDDLLTLHCRKALDIIYPVVSLHDNGGFSDVFSSEGMYDEKKFFVYEKSVVGNMSACKGINDDGAHAMKDELPLKRNTCFESEASFIDEKFTTFVCGIADEKSNPCSYNDAFGTEMFDQLNPFSLDFDSPEVPFQPLEQEMYKRLMSQNSKWQESYKPYKDFCTSNIPKPPVRCL